MAKTQTKSIKRVHSALVGASSIDRWHLFQGDKRAISAARSFIHSEFPSRCKVWSSMSGFGDAALGTTLLTMDLVGV